MVHRWCHTHTIEKAIATCLAIAILYDWSLEEPDKKVGVPRVTLENLKKLKKRLIGLRVDLDVLKTGADSL